MDAKYAKFNKSSIYRFDNKKSVGASKILTLGENRSQKDCNIFIFSWLVNYLFIKKMKVYAKFEQSMYKYPLPC